MCWAAGARQSERFRFVTLVASAKGAVLHGDGGTNPYQVYRYARWEDHRGRDPRKLYRGADDREAGQELVYHPVAARPGIRAHAQAGKPPPAAHANPA